jgi:hypothetical protein
MNTTCPILSPLNPVSVPPHPPKVKFSKINPELLLGTGRCWEHTLVLRAGFLLDRDSVVQGGPTTPRL